VFWVGPLTVASAVLGVVLVQVTAVAMLSSPPQFLEDFTEPVAFTAVLVTAGVIVFAVVSDLVIEPLKTYRRIALGALIVSLLPDFAVGMGWLFRREGCTLAIVFMIMHVVAWVVTVEMLTRLTTGGSVPDGGGRSSESVAVQSEESPRSLT
jgi:hypothetical protein